MTGVHVFITLLLNGTLQKQYLYRSRSRWGRVSKKCRIQTIYHTERKIKVPVQKSVSRLIRSHGECRPLSVVIVLKV